MSGDAHLPLAPEMVRGVAGPTDRGARPLLRWVALDRCVIDARYQRDLNQRSLQKIASIARAFDWAFFTPLILAPIENGRFAIIDGQHRATAALAIGEKEAPAQIVLIDLQTQAQAFAAINADVSRVHTMEVFHAKLAAGDEDAIALRDALARGGASICRHPRDRSRIAPEEMLCVGAARTCLKRYGGDTLATACRAIVDSDAAAPGALNPTSLMAVCEVLHTRRDWRDAGEALLRAFDALDIVAMSDEARTDKARWVGDTAVQRMTTALERALWESMGET